MPKRIDEKKRAALSFIKCYNAFERDIAEYLKLEKQRGLNELEMVDLQMKKYYCERIKGSFEGAVFDRYKDEVWNYVINKNSLRTYDEYEERDIKEEVERWVRSFQKAMNI